MEKLQVAIEHARKRRAALQQDAAEAPASGAAPKGAAALWASLTAFTPDPSHLTRNRVTTPETDGGARTSIEMLRTRLLKLMGENGWKRVMITSATPECGKSTVAVNLALALQRQPELRTLLIDLDIRRPAIGQILGLTPAHDVLAHLSGEVPAGDQLHRVGSNLAVAANTRSRHDKAEVLKSTGTGTRLDALEAELDLDVMLIDVPPMFASDDAITIAGYVDCAVIVGASEQSSLEEIEATERDLAQYTNIAGVVLNKCRFPGKTSGYDYGYR